MRLRCRGLGEKMCRGGTPLTTKSLSANIVYHKDARPALTCAIRVPNQPSPVGARIPPQSAPNARPEQNRPCCSRSLSPRIPMSRSCGSGPLQPDRASLRILGTCVKTRASHRGDHRRNRNNRSHLEKYDCNHSADTDGKIRSPPIPASQP